MADHEGQGRETLAELIATTSHPIDSHEDWRIADAILASDWLKAHDAEVSAAALREAATAYDRYAQRNGTFVGNWLRDRADEGNPR